MQPISSRQARTRQVSSTRPMGRGWVHGVVLLGYVILTLVMTWPMAAQFTSAIPGDSFDGWQNYWNLWWVKVSLIEHLQNPYATDLLYYPTGVTLYFHTLNPFNGLVTLPVQLTSGLIAAYNAVVLVSWVLAGYGMWLLARWVIGHAFASRQDNSHTRTWQIDDFAAFVAGAIFTFAPVHMAHLLGHMQVMALQWLPFYVLALLRGMTRARAGKSWLRDGVLAGLFLVLAGLCDWYFVLYLFLFTLVAIVYVWVDALIRRQWSVRLMVAVVGPAAVAGGLFALVLAPLLGPMVYEATQFSFMVRPAADLYRYSATLLDFLLPNRIHPLFRPESLGEWGNQVAPVSERTIGIGLGALVLAVVAAVTMRRKALFWLVGVLVFVLVAMGPRLHLATITAADIPLDGAMVGEWSPYAVVNRLVPFMRISRSVSRFAIVVQICVAALAGMGLAWLLRRVQKPFAALVGIVALGFVLAEYWVVPYPMSPPDTPAYYEIMAQQPSRGAVLNLPMNYDRPGYLLYQTVHHRPLTVAYISRVDPRTMTERVPLLQHWRHLGPDILDVDPAVVGMTVLADLNVETVILDRYKMPGGLERDYTEAVANALFAGVEPTHQDERITVYMVTPPTLPTPYLSMGPLNWGPLMEADGTRYRVVGEDGAQLQLHHVTRGATVVIEYQSDGDAMVVSAGGDSWRLPVAPTGGTLAVELPAGVDELIFVPQGGELRITRLGLDVVPRL